MSDTALGDPQVVAAELRRAGDTQPSCAVFAQWRQGHVQRARSITGRPGAGASLSQGVRERVPLGGPDGQSQADGGGQCHAVRAGGQHHLVGIDPDAAGQMHTADPSANGIDPLDARVPSQLHAVPGQACGQGDAEAMAVAGLVVDVVNRTRELAGDRREGWLDGKKPGPVQDTMPDSGLRQRGGPVRRLVECTRVAQHRERALASVAEVPGIGTHVAKALHAVHGQRRVGHRIGAEPSR
jgi:hypothetical protein